LAQRRKPSHGKTPYPYWNILFRPAGSINASARDMAAYVQFYLNRGMANGVQVVPAADIDRMELPTSTWAANEGPRSGYGLSNYWSLHEGFVSGEQFRYVPKKDLPEPVATLALLSPNQEGRFIQAGAMTTMKHIPVWLAMLEIALTAYVVLSIVSVLIYAPFWILGGLSKQRRRPRERAMRIWPLLAVSSLMAVVVIFILCGDDMIARLGNLTGWSAALFLATAGFAVASVASAIALWRAPIGAVRRGVHGYLIAVTVALLIATGYLAYWGVIGLRTWA
jgi:hypothetical protein